MIEAGGDERFETRFVERHAGRDEIYIEVGGTRGFNQIRDVGAGERLTSGEIGLENAKSGGFLEHAGPVLRGKFRGTLREFEGIGAIDAVKRAAMRKLAD
jgi:hypothetical protein